MFDPTNLHILWFFIKTKRLLQVTKINVEIKGKEKKLKSEQNYKYRHGNMNKLSHLFEGDEDQILQDSGKDNE